MRILPGGSTMENLNTVFRQRKIPGRKYKLNKKYISESQVVRSKIIQ